MKPTDNKILSNIKTYFALFFLSITTAACTIPIVNPTKAESVNLICDFKTIKPRFYDYTDKQMVGRIDTGLEEITPILNKFIGKSILTINSIQYVEGYFLSINDFNGKIAPDPIGQAYVEFLSDLYCLNIKSLF